MTIQLTEFIEQNHKKILKEWVEFARQLHPWSVGLSDRALQDHADELLTAIVVDMESGQTRAQKSEKAKGHAGTGALTSVGHKHASDRLETGFKLSQLISEYRALRASIVRLWAQAHGDKQAQLTRFNEAIDETLTEAAVKYSELLNSTRETFLNILGHDLRNPLSAITLGAAILSQSESLDDRQARVAARIVSSAERMARMLGYLLDLARTRLGSTLPLTLARVDLALVCRQVIGELEVVHPDSELRLESRGDLRGHWDGDRLIQVVSNLVANAVQYGTPPVRVLARPQGDDVLVQVHNYGPPISAAALKTLFEPGVRQPPANGDRNSSGLGLGLYIAREVVMAHGGTIAVSSTEIEGTTFTVQLPRGHPGKAASAPRTEGESEAGHGLGNPRPTLDRRIGDRRHASAPDSR